MRFVIYGAGGIGGTVGARLHMDGHDVVLIARGAHGQAMQQRGLRFVTPSLDTILRIDTVQHPSEMSFDRSDVVMLCMKSQHTEAALRELVPACVDDPIIVACQNGVANERMALRRFNRVYGMVVLLPAEHLKPGEVINHAENTAGCLDAGRYPHGCDDTIIDVTQALEKSGFSSVPDAKIMRHKYAKLLMNLNNAVQAVTGTGSRELSALLRNEALDCYRAAGIECATAEETRRRRADITGGTVDGHPRTGGSSLQSMIRQTGDIEADYMNGEITQLGRLHGVPTPANEVVQRVANKVARNRKPVGSISISELLAMVRAKCTSSPRDSQGRL